MFYIPKGVLASLRIRIKQKSWQFRPCISLLYGSRGNINTIFDKFIVHKPKCVLETVWSVRVKTIKRLAVLLLQSYTFLYGNPPFLGFQKFDFIGLIITILGLIITILAAKPQVKLHT